MKMNLRILLGTSLLVWTGCMSSLPKPQKLPAIPNPLARFSKSSKSELPVPTRDGFSNPFGETAGRSSADTHSPWSVGERTGSQLAAAGDRFQESANQFNESADEVLERQARRGLEELDRVDKFGSSALSRSTFDKPSNGRTGRELDEMVNSAYRETNGPIAEVAARSKGESGSSRFSLTNWWKR